MPTPLTPELELRALNRFRELLDMAPEAREQALLARDPEIAERVRALLACVEEDDLAQADPASPPVGQRIGPYTLLERIGEGGMGEVFLAERSDGAYDRKVAIKRIWAGHAPLAARFLRERQSLARLQHPHIAQLLDGGIDAQGKPWLAMELVRGQDIATWCDAHDAPLSRRVELLIQICEAVDHAHRQLIVHRDIKPSNILVDDEGRAKLLDFGIARMLDAEDGERTQTQAMTPAWATPEQLQGKPATTASDVYQLGLLARALLCGVPRGAAGARMSAEYAQLQRDDPARAAVIAQQRGTTIDGLQRRLRGDLDSMVALATAHEAHERYPGALAFAMDFRRWLRNQPVQARADERGYRMRRFIRRRWPLLAAVGAVTALSIGFTAYHLHALDAELHRTEQARVAAVEAQAAAERERANAQSTAAFLLSAFRSATPGEIAEDRVSVRTLLARTRTRLDESDEPRTVRGPLLLQLGRIYLDQGMLAEAEETLHESVKLSRDPAVPPGTLAQALRSWSEALYLKGDRTASLAAAREAVAALDRSPERGSPMQAGLMGNVAIVEQALGDRSTAMRTLQRAIDLLSPRAQEAPNVQGALLNSLAAMEANAGELASSADHFRQALAEFRRMRPRQLDYELTARLGLINDLGALGHHAEAMQEGRTLVTEARNYYGPTHPDTIQTLHDTALNALLAGDAPAAVALVQEAHAALASTDASAMRTGAPEANQLLSALLVLENDGLPKGRRALEGYLSDAGGAEADVVVIRAGLACMADVAGARAYPEAIAGASKERMSARLIGMILARHCLPTQ